MMLPRLATEPRIRVLVIGCLVVSILGLVGPNNETSHAAALAAPGDVIISEVEADTTDSVPGTGIPDAPEEWIELTNTTGLQIAINGWTLNGILIPSFFIAPGGSAIIAFDPIFLLANYTVAGNVIVEPGSPQLPGGLRNRFGQLTLADEMGNTIDVISWGDDLTNPGPCTQTDLNMDMVIDAADLPAKNTTATITRTSASPCIVAAGAANPTATPTAATLGSFTANANTSKNQVFIRWQTLNESDFAGFNILRSESVNGPYIRLNEEVIPAQASGSATGARYIYTDEDVQLGGVYFYLLQSVRLDGTTDSLGVVRVKYSGYVEEVELR